MKPLKNLLTILLILLPLSAYAWGVVVSSGGVAAAGGGVSWGDAPPSKNVWYSCSPFGTGDIKTGSPTITIETGGKATLSVAQTGNIGQGDRVTYDTSSVAYIAKVVDSSHFYLVTATGGTPGNVSGQTVNSIAHEYASLYNASIGLTDSNHVNNTSLVAADVLVNIAVYYDHADDTPCGGNYLINITTDSTRYIRFYAPNGGAQSIYSQRHAGVWAANKAAIIYDQDGWAWYSNTSKIVIEGLLIRQLHNSSTSACIAAGGTTVTFNILDCIIHRPASAADGPGVIVGAGTLNFINSVIYGESITTAINDNWNTINASILNSVIASGTTAGIVQSGGGTYTVTNTVVFNTGNDFSGTMTITYCASDDGDGTNSVDISPGATETTEWAKAFTDYANGDFSVKDTNSVLYGAGIVQTGVTTDIIGTSRGSVGAACDIGAFEYVSE